jgi:hypothetical protein
MICGVESYSSLPAAILHHLLEHPCALLIAVRNPSGRIRQPESRPAALIGAPDLDDLAGLARAERGNLGALGVLALADHHRLDDLSGRTGQRMIVSAERGARSAARVSIDVFKCR